MRFNRLGFLAFGPFTGLELDLSGGAPGGFHMVFGPNEAGKSSALRGVRDLLFGFPERTPDAHVHPNPDLRIAATLSAEDGRVVQVQRLKRRKDALRDAHDAPVDENVLGTLLGGVDAALFERLFGLDHERLQKAGEALLRDQGDVGESLFDAGSGGRGIRGVLQELEQEADGIFKGRSSKASLNVLLESYKEAKGATRDALVSPEKWQAQRERLEAERKKLDELSERRKQLREESNTQSRLDAVLGPIAQRNDLRGKLDALGALPPLPADATERRLRAQRVLDEALHERARLERDLQKKRERLAELVLPENLLGVSGEAIGELRDRVGGYRQAEKDLPKRWEEVRRYEADVQRLVTTLYPGRALDSLEALRPSPIELSRVRKLPQRQAALHERIANLQKASRGLEAQRARALSSLGELPAARELGVLRRVVSAARAQADIERRVREATANCAKLQSEAQAKLSALGLWSGSLEALPGLRVPSEETVERFQHEFAERAVRALDLDREHAALAQRLAQCSRRIKAIEGSGSVPSEAALEQARVRRDDGLRRVLAAWQHGAATSVVDEQFDPASPLAEGFERSIAVADEQADRLRREAERVGLVATLAAEHEQLSAEQSTLAIEFEELDARKTEGERAWQAAWAAIGVAPSSPPEMRAWVGRQRALAELVLRLADAQREQGAATLERAGLISELNAALGRESDAGSSFAALLAACEDEVETGTRAVDRRRELGKALEDIEREKTELEQELAAERHALEAWQGEWRAATERLGFARDLSPDELTALLDSVSGLFDGLVKLQEQRRRATRIEEDHERFRAHVAEWTKTYAPDLADRAPDVAAEELVRRVQAAEHQRAESAQIQLDLSELQSALSSLEVRTEHAASELESLRVSANAAELDALPGIEARVLEARDLRRQLDAVEGSLLKDQGVPLESLVAAARGVDRTTLKARLAELSEETERVDDEHKNLSLQVRDLEYGLSKYADTDAADYAQSLSVQAAEIREQALRYARLKLSSVVLQRGIERYREQNQGPVLKRASALFPRLTLNRYRGLRVGVEERQIVALRDDGKEVSVDGLSEGARYQLYLALRVASLERYLERNPPLPLVLDDILIHFDDERVEAAFGVLGELAERMQILFFTHHARHLSLAAGAIPEARLFRHSLSGPLLK